MPLRPAMFETFALVHRAAGELSAATRVVVDAAAARMSALQEVIRTAPR